MLVGRKGGKIPVWRNGRSCNGERRENLWNGERKKHDGGREERSAEGREAATIEGRRRKEKEMKGKLGVGGRETGIYTETERRKEKFVVGEDRMRKEGR